MSERYPVNHENNAETHANKQELAKHHERLAEHHEKEATQSHEKGIRTQEALREVHEQAISGKEFQKPQSEHRQPEPANTKEAKVRSFNTTMHHVRNNLSRPERTFSKFIHKPLVEKTSEVVGATIARPSGMAGATIAAFIGLLSVYGVARFAGFELSGSEIPLLLAIGFVAGLLFEWLYKSAQSLFARR
jgi:glutamate/tyrosine decarboxylase-like PLP-dependent enzyme